MYYLNYPAIGNNYHVVIAEEQKNSILKATEYLNNVSYIENKFDFALGNYYDFQKILLEKSLADSIRPSFDISEIMKCERDLTRYLFNLLSAIYAYTEQIQTLRRKLNLVDPDIIKKNVQEFENKNTSTKLIIDLRDHIQHFGISTNISLGSCDITNQDENLRYLFFYNTLNLDIKRCKEDSKMKKHLSFLKNSKEKIEICEHIKIYFKEFCQLHEKTRELLSEELKKNINSIENIFEFFKTETNFEFGEGQKILGIFSEENNSDSYLFTDNIIREINDLINRNSNLSNIESRFACNASYTQLKLLKNCVR